MKNKLKTIFLSLTILTMIMVFAIPQKAEANWATSIMCLMNSQVCGVADAAISVIMVSLAAEIGNLFLSLSAWVLSLAGIVLNISIILTMNIKTIFEATPAIGQVWIVIRNISSMFIIFGLIYTSILTILDIAKPDVKRLITNIIIAGLLINFSLYFTKVLVDTSNLVSLQIYRAIAPEAKGINLKESDLASIVSTTWTSGGISDTFKESLRIPSIWNNKKGLISGVQSADYFNILISTVSGSVLIIFAALSFFAAAIAFIIRIVVLLLLMAFSPVYFIGIMFPQVKSSVSDKWQGWLTGQLVFMPAYLMMMYVAMKFISGTGGENGSFFALLNKTSSVATGQNGVVLLSSVGLILQFTIAFILINIPLLVATSLGGKSMVWGNKAGAWAGGLLNGARKGVTGMAGRNTIGRLGSAADKYLENTPIGNSVWGRDFRAVTTGKMANAKFGSSRSQKDMEKEDKNSSRAISALQRTKAQLNDINSVILSSAPPSATEIDRLRKNSTGMNIKELEKLDFSVLNNPVFAASLTSQQVEKISDADFLTEQEKIVFKKTRSDKLNDVLMTHNADLNKEYMKGLSGKELSKLKPFTDPGLGIRNDVVKNLTASQLREMTDIDTAKRRTIGGLISGDRTHKAHGFITNPNNVTEWS